MQPQPPMPVMKERMAAELPAAAVRAPPPPRPLSSPPAEVAMREVDVPKKAARPPPPITTPIREKPAKSPVPEEPSPPHASLNSSSGSSFNAPGAPGPEVDQLKREIEQLKTNMVPKAQYDELLTEVKTLTEQMGNLKSLFQKRMLDLMNEVDEEKKVRLNMQVEIDRIKKLTLASNS
ncbi:hypothetical protein CAPTEDRAFT_160605 [Capitella teleta]|uniref:Uncharacterized protein n=1 Tax=Capitella teleta TaxID=283909 RepID=R7U1P9_CAPTE|nr:hypothetical protein CAPTEDRAFT_160605 [Capitella teleta]|eukprot:ELT97110.1 hypothetical protein CAPTEDRAFT_160605 [Capitella teleta]